MSSALEEVSGLAIAGVRSMSDIVAGSTGRARFDMWLMTLFGGSALLLSVVGVYGLTAHSVQEREREIGIRLAIGAAPVDVRNMLFRQGVGIALLGIAVGSVAAMGLGRVMAGLLFGVSPRDPVVLVAVSVLLGTVAIVTVWIPARRSTKVQPMTALRAD
jgi:ABC-type antimicrobial peptide transport system permease subunit